MGYDAAKDDQKRNEIQLESAKRWTELQLALIPIYIAQEVAPVLRGVPVGPIADLALNAGEWAFNQSPVQYEGAPSNDLLGEVTGKFLFYLILLF